MLALLDFDIYCFRAAASCQHIVDGHDDHGNAVKLIDLLPVQIAYARLNEMIEITLRELETEEYKGFLTDSAGNFRKVVSPDYKANRADIPRPIHLKALEEFVIKNWGAIRAVQEEADDLLGIAQTACAKEGTTSIICSIDKDLKQIPGEHYNFVKKERFTTTENESSFFFFKQLMMGDSTDNISGIPGIGPKKAEKFLMPYFGNEHLMMREVWEQYKEAYPHLALEELEDLITTVGRLVYIRRKPGEMWTIPDTFENE